ncbi:MAG: iron ABC transporter permease [Phycisphaerales bacterium]
MTRRAVVAILILLALLAGAVLLRLAIGTERLGFAQSDQVARLRLIRVLAACAVGCGLAGAGVLLQALMRNPLAAPDLLGLSAGASLAVLISAYVGYLATGAVTPSAADPVSAFIGAVLALAFVYSLSQRRGFVEPVTLILVGVVVSILCGAAGALVKQFMPDGGFAVSRLLVGRISDDLSMGMVTGVLVVVLVCTLIGAALGPAMDASSMSDDEAKSVGVSIGRLRAMLFVLAGVMTAGTVVLAGPIGFVGLVVPHAVRLVVGPSHRGLVIGSALLGASAVLLADSGVRMLPMSTGRLPIGVVTALVGGPIFLWMLYVSLRRPGGLG